MTSDAEARTADVVRAFYDQHAYPQPVEDLESYRVRWQEEARRRVEHHRLRPERAFGPPASILVAGCGTAQAARYALREPEAQVVGIDVSASSLEATRALKARYGLDNLKLVNLAIEDAGRLDLRFDLVVSTGVIHHLPDPARGLDALAAVLAPGGALHLMVYAPYGRAGVYLIQDYARLLGIGASSEEIRELAATLRELPLKHPLRPLLENSKDFRSEAGLADALLNPQDRPYSVPQLFELVLAAGLGFSRWLRQAPYRPQCGAMLLTPHAERLARLPERDQYTAMELWRGTMTRHSVVLRRPDDLEAGSLDWQGDSWREWVPIRERDTICVEERIPETAAGVLINRKHGDPDLYLPIDASQKALFDRIDGRRTIGELLRENQGDAGRDLFERLWWYDQVVFDTSAARRGKVESAVESR